MAGKDENRPIRANLKPLTAKCACCEALFELDYGRLYCGTSTRCADDAAGCRGLCLNPDRRGSECQCCGAFVPAPRRGPARRFCRSSHKSCQTEGCIRLCKARLPDDEELVAAYREAWARAQG